MRLLHCTQRLFKELAVVPMPPDVTQINPDGLGN